MIRRSIVGSATIAPSANHPMQASRTTVRRKRDVDGEGAPRPLIGSDCKVEAETTIDLGEQLNPPCD